MGRDRLTVKPLPLPGCALASAFECLFDGLTVRTDDFTKIIPGGNSGAECRPRALAGDSLR
jgi:hypothetical protein